MNTTNESVKYFKDIKEKVERLIKTNSFREVTSETNFKVSGIYMIYINHWSSDKTSPIYIGQSEDIQRRYQNHLMEILALNRLSYSEYEKYFFRRKGSLYDGSFKASKIFKFMLENDCVLSDFRMVILEESLKEDLDEREEEYFKSLLPSYLGFNQLNSMLARKKIDFTKDAIENTLLYKFLDELIRDIYYIDVFYDFGFTQFNFEYSLTKSIDSIISDRKNLRDKILSKIEEAKYELEILLNEYLPEYKVIKEMSEKKHLLSFEFFKSQGEFFDALNDLKSKLKKKFKELNYRSIKAQENFLNSILQEEKVKYKNQFEKYLKSKQTNIDFYHLYQTEIQKLKLKHKLFIEYKMKYDELSNLVCENLFKNYEMIFPKKQFDSFPLKDYPKNLSISLNDNYFPGNTCHLRIYISNNARGRDGVFKDPDIIRVDYLYIDHEVNKVENSYYIKNWTTENSQEGIFYIERDFYNYFWKLKRPFTISSFLYGEQDDSFISTLAEYKHGINDYTLKDKELFELENVFDEIRNLIDKRTRFDVKVVESYPSLDKSLKSNIIKRDDFIERLISKKLPKLKKKK